MGIENVIDEIARYLGKDPLDVRKINFYGKEHRNVTPYGMTLEDNIIHELVDQLEIKSGLSGKAPAGGGIQRRRRRT